MLKIILDAVIVGLILWFGFMAGESHCYEKYQKRNEELFDRFFDRLKEFMKER